MASLDPLFPSSQSYEAAPPVMGVSVRTALPAMGASNGTNLNFFWRTMAVFFREELRFSIALLGALGF